MCKHALIKYKRNFLHVHKYLLKISTSNIDFCLSLCSVNTGDGAVDGN